MPQKTQKTQTEAQLAQQHEDRHWGSMPRFDEKPDAPAIAAARQELRRLLKPGATVYVALQGNPSASGMTRHLKLFVVNKGRIQDVTALAARAQGDRVYDRDGRWTIKAQGAGMDMGFHEVYGLGRNLYPNGFKTTKATGARNADAVGSRDKDGGYAFRHEWL